MYLAGQSGSNSDKLVNTVIPGLSLQLIHPPQPIRTEVEPELDAPSGSSGHSSLPLAVVRVRSPVGCSESRVPSFQVLGSPRKKSHSLLRTWWPCPHGATLWDDLLPLQYCLPGLCFRSAPLWVHAGALRSLRFDGVRVSSQSGGGGHPEKVGPRDVFPPGSPVLLQHLLRAAEYLEETPPVVSLAPS